VLFAPQTTSHALYVMGCLQESGRQAGLMLMVAGSAGVCGPDVLSKRIPKLAEKGPVKAWFRPTLTTSSYIDTG